MLFEKRKKGLKIDQFLFNGEKNNGREDKSSPGHQKNI